MAEIHYLLSKPDNIEIIRNRITSILTTETENQTALAEAADAEDKNDYRITVHTGQSGPWITAPENAGADGSSVINISLDSVKQQSHPGGTVNEKKYTASFFIDCYGFSNAAGTPDSNTRAAGRAWKTARIVRNILMSGFYTNLGLRGTVKKREITGMKTEVPENTLNPDISVMYCRITFTVDYIEESPQAEPVPLERIAFESPDNNGEINIKM